MVSVYLKRKTDCCPSSEWIVRLYPDNRRAGGSAFASTEAETIPPPVLPNTKRYKPKLWQAPFLFPYQMKITLAPKRLVAQRRRHGCVYKAIAEASETFWGEGAVTERTRNAQFSIGCSECSAAHRDAGFQRDESLWAYPSVSLIILHIEGAPHDILSLYF